MKKIFTIILAVSLCFSVFAGGNKEKTTDATTSASATKKEKMQSYTINYPQNLQEAGFTEPVVLEKMPKRVVAMSNTPVLALYEMGVEMVGIPATSIVQWPKDLDEKTTKLNIAMNANFDIETVIALAPDLVIVGKTSVDTYGKIFDDANIPVYYVDAGHTVSYESVKTLTYELLDAFGKKSKAADKIRADFDKLEKRLEENRKANAGRSVMVLQSSPPAHYIQTKNGTLASMLDMMGFANVYENNEASLLLLDLEKAISYDPDLFFGVGMAKSSEEYKGILEADFARNPDYWNSIAAIKNGDTFYLPISFIASAGINVIDNINNLIDMIEEHDAK